MPRLLIDRPWEANRTVADMTVWIARLDQMARRFEGDPEALDDIARERESAERLLAELEKREAAGVPSPRDEGGERVLE